MAVNVSENYRTTIYGGERIYSCSLSINDNVISPRQIKQITISRPIIDKTKQSFYIGSFIANMIEVTFKNINDLDIASGYEVNLSIALKVNGEDEWVNQGTFIIDDLGENYQKNNKITCYDYSVKFEPAVNTNIEDVFDAGESGETYSISLENLLIWLCNHYGVTLGTYPNINRDVLVGNWDSTISGKQYISWIAEMMAGNAKIGRDNTLNIIPLNSAPVYTVNALRSKSLEIGEKYRISHVVYFDAIRNFTFPLPNLYEYSLTNGETPIETTGCTVTLQDNIYSFTATDTAFQFGKEINSGTAYRDGLGKLYPINSEYLYTLECTNEVFNNCYITAFDENQESLGFIQINSDTIYTPPSNAEYVTLSIGKSDATVGETYTTSVIFKQSVEEYNTLQIRQDNLFVVDDLEIENIYNSVKDFEIYSLKNENFGDLSLDAYDIITYQTNTNSYNTFYNPQITYNGSVMVKTEVKIPTKQQEITTNKVQLDSQASVRKVLTEVNGITGQIRLLSQRTNDNASDIAELQISDNEIRTSISNVSTSTNEQINELTTALNETKTATYSKTEIQQIANGTYEDEQGNLVAVSNVINSSGTFDIDGMHYSKTGAETETTINQDGLEIDSTSNGAELLYAGYDTDSTSDTYGTSVVRTQNLTVRYYLRCGGVGRFEAYTDSNNNSGVGFFIEG